MKTYPVSALPTAFPTLFFFLFCLQLSNSSYTPFAPVRVLDTRWRASMAIASEEPRSTARVPAWKKLGLTLQSQSDAASSGNAVPAPAQSVTIEKNVSKRAGRNAAGEASLDDHAGGRGQKRRWEKENATIETPQSGKRFKQDYHSQESTPTHQNSASAQSYRAALSNPWGKGAQEESGLHVEPIRPKRVVFSPEVDTHIVPSSNVIPESVSEPSTQKQPPQSSRSSKESPEKSAAKKEKKKKKGKSTLLPSTEAAAADYPEVEDNEDAKRTPKTRRKSVTFTPDTKVTDGDSAQRYFKGWLGQSEDESEIQTDPALEQASFSGPAAVSPVSTPPATKKEKKNKPKNTTSPPQSKKASEDPKDRWAFVNYLHAFQHSPATWKFNKSQQTDLLKHCFNMWRVPSSYEEAFQNYISGLQGDGMKNKLRQNATSALSEVEKELEKMKAKGVDGETTAAACTNATKAHGEALEERLKTDRKRRREQTEQTYLQSEEYQQLLAKRRRAEAVLEKFGPPVQEDAQSKPNSTPIDQPGSNSAVTALGNRRRLRKQRSTGVPDDDSSSSEDEDLTSTVKDSLTKTAAADGIDSNESDSASASSSSSSEEEDSNSESSEGSSSDEADDSDAE